MNKIKNFDKLGKMSGFPKDLVLDLSKVEVESSMRTNLPFVLRSYLLKL